MLKDCKDEREQWSPFGAGEKEKLGLSETTLVEFVERLCERGPALKEKEGLWSTEEGLCDAWSRLLGWGGMWGLLMLVPVAETAS